MDSLRSLLFDLFEFMRSPQDGGMKLTPEQFDLLCEAVEQSDFIREWGQLKRICRLVWVKPHEHYDGQRFDRTFERYVEICGDAVDVFFQKIAIESKSDPSPPVLGGLPTIPPRFGVSKRPPPMPPSPAPDILLPQDGQMPIAVSIAKPVRSQFGVRDVPISFQDFRQIWRSLRRIQPDSHERELDLEATVEKAVQQGFLGDIAERPLLKQRGELLLLVDDDNPMTPYGPAIEPIVRSALENRVGRSKVYRFTTVPTQYLYRWSNPTQADKILTVLSQCHRQRTIAVIISDAGAAMGTYKRRRVERTGEFLSQLIPCVRDVFWLNPVSRQRWPQTSAESIAEGLGGRMIALDRLQLHRAVRGDGLAKGVAQWQPMQ